ncbi:MAG: glycosyltransferase family 2 protein [Eubacteriales bacterium]
MTTHIKVSIVLPVYNVEKYLHQCLDSLCAQTLGEIEIICVDDGSQDHSMKILEDFAQKDNRIKIFSTTEEKSGAAHARNLGIDKAAGVYLLILDSDDYFHPELAEKTYQKAIETDVDFVLFDGLAIDNVSGEPDLNLNYRLIQYGLLPEKEVFSPLEIQENIFQITHGNAWTKLYKTSFVKGNHLEFQPLKTMNDSFFTYSSYVTAKKIVYIDEALVYYRVNNKDSLSHHLDPLAPLKFAVLLKEFLINKGLFHAYSKSFMRAAAFYTRWYLRALSGYGEFRLLYHGLQNEGIEYLFGDLDFDANQEFQWLKEIKSLPCEEFLYHSHQKAEQNTYEVPASLQDCSLKVILYGGGVGGRTLYSEIILNQHCNIVAWVDKNYEDIGFPVTGLDTLATTEFDRVFITLKSLEECKKIKEDLIQMGIEKEKIMYQDTF